jgi:succinate dehydrogenase / fumarate reductase iron-sulfur subunit
VSENGHGATMRITLKVWRQDGPAAPGSFETHEVPGVSPDMSFLEMLGVPHGPERGTATCQLHMRKFRDGDQIVVEPWRAAAFPVIRDVAVDRSAFDRIVESGGYISTPTGAAPDANLTLIPKPVADAAMDAAACIGCGACVAACPNSAAQLFTAAKLAHLNLLPQGQAERWARTESMVETMEEFFGSCTNHGECEEACPKQISIDFIAMMNRDYVKSKRKNRQLLSQA